MLNVELVQRENANLEVMDLPLNIQKNSSATTTNAISSKIKIPPAFDEEIAEYQRKPLTGFSSSKKTLNCPEVNTRFVYGMRQIGKGFSAGFKLCGTLNLPRLSKTAYTNHENKLMSVISEVSELSMQKAASERTVSATSY
ncbi:hypothetical protein TNCV_2074461 [Trichonephila clavipes]|nr:hypothetical protein TNCV_2074461 [Trichonephila clavipes]